ncbi:MAG: bifunctional alpha,alpha-trehalose-phosphate synthase (UDP-forming)/trehalose-phosphatase [Bacteroidota bacterium]|nr:bifunctional alpha,alpha-trehalose-phosphate synthase (UDP-forming)/trehalose-phosphatase [Bacteroidota bacterium]
MSRLIIISSRLPYSIDKTDENITLRQSSGGLVSALKSFFEKTRDQQDHYTEKIWIGSLDASVEEWETAREDADGNQDFRVEPIFVDPELYEGFYNGFSNSTLWPLFHYFPSIVQYDKNSYSSYIKVNEQFAEKILNIYQKGDVIWVHDYQLMLVPKLLRDKLPEATIGFFLHIPFPSYELVRLLPTAWKKQILEGMLGADLIGFHTHDYVQHFIQSAKMILQVENQFNTIHYNNRVIKADLFPIGIDYKKFRNAISDKVVVAINQSLEDRFSEQKILFSVDRLDYTKGLNYRLKGFEEFLEKYPEWIGKVVFILNVIPSRDLIPAYIERKREIEEKVSTINGRYSTLHWQPLIYRFNHLAFDELCALYQTADVALITPLRDGMNLVAKEYVASCLDKGVLILSELTGAASELNEAIIVNPTDTEEVADAIAEALLMPLIEQRSRLSYMQRRLSQYDVVKWISDFLDVLNSTKEEQRQQRVNLLNYETMAQITQQYVQANKRCILLDYDGTLAPYQKLPSMAVPASEIIDLLNDLCSIEQNEVVIISGRDVDSLDKWLGKLPINLVAEHGACIKYKGGDWQQQVTTSPEWKDEIRPLMELFVTRCVGSFIEEKGNTLAWHYRNTHPDLGFIRSRDLRNSLLQLITNTPLQVIDGNKVLEVRLAGIDKGATALKIVQHFQPDFTFCIGDDTTDEDMFRVLRDTAFTVRVGGGNTAAKYTLSSQQQVYPLLQKFLAPAPKEEYGYS